MKKQIEEKNRLKTEKEASIRKMEGATTSVKPTIDNINTVLSMFGFTNFKLAIAENERYYKLIRSDGNDAKNTLSDGEKNFITFLYFYQLLKGSFGESGMTVSRVVVFDDPVSSLDCDVMFVVSAIIKEVMDWVVCNLGNIKQIFVFTHNVYFHKEVTFVHSINKNMKMKDKTFWIMKKLNGVSQLKLCEGNPIKSSYELLWSGVRNPDLFDPAVPNTLRRIIENYFTIFGNQDSEKVCNLFGGQERIVCKSLFSWINAGSHIIYDDPFISDSSHSVKIYLDVFKKIFEKTENIAHYNMMMGEES